MNGRWFDERQLEAYIANGNEKFKKSNEKSLGIDDEEDEEMETDEPEGEPEGEPEEPA